MFLVFLSVAHSLLLRLVISCDDSVRTVWADHGLYGHLQPLEQSLLHGAVAVERGTQLRRVKALAGAHGSGGHVLKVLDVPLGESAHAPATPCDAADAAAR